MQEGKTFTLMYSSGRYCRMEMAVGLSWTFLFLILDLLCIHGKGLMKQLCQISSDHFRTSGPKTITRRFSASFLGIIKENVQYFMFAKKSSPNLPDDNIILPEISLLSTSIHLS